MTFSDISKAVYRRVKLADTPSSTDSTRIQQFINLWYREILAMPGMDQLRDTTITFATVATQKKYGLPQALVKIRDVYDLSNQRRVLPRTLDYLRNVDPGLTATSSTVENWIPLNGWGAEAVELTSTGVGLWAVSSSASDTTQRVFVETTRLGGVSGGTAVSAGTLITGTTRVQIGSLTDHVEIVKFYISAAAVGTISLYDAASNGNLLSTIQIGRTSARYYMIQVYPTPGAAITLSVDCQRSIQDMVQATEEPLLPEDYHHILVHLACYEEWLNRDDTRALREYNPDPRGIKGHANILLDNLRHFLLTSPDEIPVQRGPRGTPQRVSRLGGYFPAGS